MVHPLVVQLRFARSEFARCLEGVSDEDARQRIMPMNSISWMVGHLAAQEQYYFGYLPQGELPHPKLSTIFGFGRPATTPVLEDMWQVWRDVTASVDSFLDTLTTEMLEEYPERNTQGLEEAYFGVVNDKMLAKRTIKSNESHGTKILRTTYHYFFHTGEAHAIRQQLGHPDLPYFVGPMPADLFIEE